jgi:glycerate kinase
MGKGVGSLCQLCEKSGVKFIALAGSLSRELVQHFPGRANVALFGIVPYLATLEEAKAEPAKWLSLLAGEAAKKVGAV